MIDSRGKRRQGSSHKLHNRLQAANAISWVTNPFNIAKIINDLTHKVIIL